MARYHMSVSDKVYIVYNNTIKFKLHFMTLCDTHGFKPKLTSVTYPQANAILEQVHQTIMGMLHTAEINMAIINSKSDITGFLTNVTWTVHSTYHTILKVSPGIAIFGRDMLFDAPFIADWNKIVIHWQCQTDCNTACENNTWIEWDCKVGNQMLVETDGILHKSERMYDGDPWTITSLHMN